MEQRDNDPTAFSRVPGYLRPPCVDLPIDIRFPREVNAAQRAQIRRDQFLEQVESDALALQGYMKHLRKYGPLEWHHRPGYVRIEAGGHWVIMRRGKGRRLRMISSLGW